jgi:hypothetical protein
MSILSENGAERSMKKYLNSVKEISLAGFSYFKGK